MIRSRFLAMLLLVLGLIALTAPVLALASGSAGDQQYTDPLAGQTPPPAQHTTSTPAPAPAPVPTSAPASAPPAVTPTTSQAPPAAAATNTTSSPTPTATIAGTATTGTISPGAARQLPYTGYPSWLAAGLGFVLVLGGLGLRRRSSRV